MIKKIIKALNKKEVSAYRIIETVSKTVEEFFVLQNLETTRQTETLEDHVTVYKEFEEDGKKYLGASNFIISHNVSQKELEGLIEEALFASSFVKNEYYELVKGTTKKNYKAKNQPENPFELLQNIAKIFIDSSNDKCKFNSLELFYNEVETHIVNSNGVDYKKNTFTVQVEAIPSYKDANTKTELYRMFKYDNIDFDKIKEDSKNAIHDVLLRSQAVKNEGSKKVNVILKDEHVKDLFRELISTYNYPSVYHKSNFKSIGEEVQDNPVCKMNISLKPSSKADYFDSEGILLKESELIKDGVLKAYYGPNRFAYYLGVEPTGSLNTIKLGKGTKSVEKFKKEPYIEIIDLSGIQLDLYAGYIGGEVRLANYFDGQNTYPISGFSFSGNLNECVNSFELSKETTTIQGYEGPKYVLLKQFEIC